MEEARETSSRFVDPAEVDFTKSEYPPRGIDDVVSMFPLSDQGPHAGLFYITLYFRKSLKNKFQRKGILLQINGDGANLTHAAAWKDAINHRMELAGDFEEVLPGRWAEKEATSAKRARKGHLNSNFSAFIIIVRYE